MMLNDQQLNDLSKLLNCTSRKLTDSNIESIKRHLTSLLFAGCDSTIIRHFVACNKHNRKGNKFWGLLRSIELDRKITQSQIKQLLKIIVVE